MNTKEILLELERMPLDTFMLLCFALFASVLIAIFITHESLFNKDTWIAPDMSDEETRKYYEEKKKKV